MEAHPFTNDRLVGTVIEVEGSFANLILPEAQNLPGTQFGERVGKGEIGEFLIIDVGGLGIFARLIQIGVHSFVASQSSHTASRNSPVGRVQLLSTLDLGGKTLRGISKYPRVGDPVYSASEEVIRTVITFTEESDNPSISIGKLSIGGSTEVLVPVSKLFGRHMAIVGATGSGKSWTMAHLAESVHKIGGKLILIDATGEFHTLRDKATHLTFGSIDSEPMGATLVGLPHFMMSETDRNAFLNPSSGSQLPKLREAVRSLRLWEAIRASGETNSICTGDGFVIKSGN